MIIYPTYTVRYFVADTDDYARVALPAAAAPLAAAAASTTEDGIGLSEDSNNESCSDMESVIESEQGVIV